MMPMMPSSPVRGAAPLSSPQKSTQLRENVNPAARGKSAEVFPTAAKVWLPDPKLGFVPGQVMSPLTRGQSAKVLVETQNSTGPIEFFLSAQASVNVEPFDTTSNAAPDDLADLQLLNNASLLHALRLRFGQHQIYTSIGHTLVSLNPYERVAALYSTEAMDAYLTDAQRSAPHVYQSAARVYRASATAPQTVVFSGESGSGKTEAMKIFTAFLAHASARADDSQAASQTRERLLQATPLIEAFGNAQTLRNHNSSRFGTHACVVFEGGAVRGAKLSGLLLEKTRVVRHAPGERNFHVFYQVASALPQPAAFRYIRVDEARPERDAAGLRTTLESMRVLGVDAAAVLELVHGLLELGNVDFTGNSNDGDVAQLCCAEQLAKAAALLRIDADALAQALLVRDVSNGRESVATPHTPAQATAARDALAMHTYGRLFDWLVSAVNSGVQPPLLAPSSSSSPTEEARTVSLLDMFGFEVLPANSFEQLAINYANEKLHLFFSETCIRAELSALRAEDVSTAHLDFGTNRACIDLFESALHGVLSMVDDELKIPGGADEHYLRKLRDKHTGHAHFVPYISAQKNANAKTVFGIRHYAGDVYYSTDGFLAKNRDALPVSLERVCAASKSGLVGRELFSESAVPALAARAAAKVSRGIRFRDELSALLAGMARTHTSFVRCIKPNASDAAGVFNGALVLEQLCSAGVLHACVVRKEGYAVRSSRADFIARYGILAPEVARAGGVEALAAELARRFGGSALALQVGKSRVFATADVTSQLERALAGHNGRAATLIQRAARGFATRRKLVGVSQWVRALAAALDAADERGMDALLRAVPTRARHLALVRRAEQLSSQLKEAGFAEAQLRFAIEANAADALAAAVAEASSVRDVTGRLAPLLARARALLTDARALEASRQELLRVAKFADLTLLASAVAHAEKALPPGDAALAVAVERLEALAATRVQRLVRRRQFAHAVKALLAEAGDVEHLTETDAPRVAATLQRAQSLGVADHPWVRGLEARLRRLEERLGVHRKPEFLALADCLAWGRRALSSGAPVDARALDALADAVIAARQAGVPSEYLKEAAAVEARLRDRFMLEQASGSAKRRRWWHALTCGCASASPPVKRKTTLKDMPVF